ncbi:hypothetical protein [Streptomyces zhihengii]|uniref:Minor tail protein n=1 Tax=Streptomyces zhihengii TaxID=1818004 RepID=A0ABS2UU40_9ACTN|nr:hypothetical protein [Streptomyces zhihengii]MBM9621035.1 hypothetical protein [Streptomyces zhihengii]
MPTDPTWQNTVAYDGAELRRADSMLLMGNAAAGGGRSGVRPGDPGLTVSLAGSTINVSAGVAAIAWPGQGVYRVALPASVSPGSVAAAHATLPRIDLVYLRVWDTDVDASGLRQADPVYLAGTASSTPAAPTPAGTVVYMPLATISVPASGGGSPAVSTAVRPLTVAPGGILPGQASTPASPYTGQAWHDGTDLKVWNGSSVDTYAKVRNTPYTALSVASGFTTPFGSLSPLGARLVVDDGVTMVKLRGSVGCTSDVTTAQVFATFPAQFRPPATQLRTITVARNYNASTMGSTRVEIAANGTATVYGSVAPGQTTWFCFDGCEYDI